MRSSVCCKKFSISNMAEQKVSTDSETLEVTHNELKDIIKKKAKEKGWDEKEENDFVSSLLKLYKETVELALRENVSISETPTSTSKVKQEMEPVDKARATEVNEMCEKSEELLTQTIKKRKTYPQKIKERLCMKHDAELMNLQKLEDDVRNKVENTAKTNTEACFDMTECESSWPRLTPACESLTRSSKLLSEKEEKLQRFDTVAKMNLKMQNNELHRTLFSKRKLPSSFHSILATPTKELKLDETITDSNDNTLPVMWGNQENEKLKSLKGCKRLNPQDQNLQV